MRHAPLLYLVFNRPDLTRKTFQKIRELQVEDLFIACDGPRDHVATDKCNVESVRSIVSEIDWPCNVRQLFQSSNLGCKNAVVTAINWFFSNVDSGIILEDDILMDTSFYSYCVELLDVYKSDPRVWIISGFSIDPFDTSTSYRFSNLAPIWGWASWKEKWINYDINMNEFYSYSRKIFKVFGKYEWYVRREFSLYFNSSRTSWDYQWGFTILKNNGLSLLPANSLVSNIGLGVEGATHTTLFSKEFAAIESNHIEFPLSHPVRDYKVNKIQDSNYISRSLRMAGISTPKLFLRRLLFSLASLIQRFRSCSI
jgi:hypothetical protein